MSRVRFILLTYWNLCVRYGVLIRYSIDKIRNDQDAFVFDTKDSNTCYVRTCGFGQFDIDLVLLEQC